MRLVASLVVALAALVVVELALAPGTSAAGFYAVLGVAGAAAFVAAAKLIGKPWLERPEPDHE